MKFDDFSLTSKAFVIRTRAANQDKVKTWLCLLCVVPVWAMVQNWSKGPWVVLDVQSTLVTIRAVSNKKNMQNLAVLIFEVQSVEKNCRIIPHKRPKCLTQEIFRFYSDFFQRPHPLHFQQPSAACKGAKMKCCCFRQLQRIFRINIHSSGDLFGTNQR